MKLAISAMASTALALALAAAAPAQEAPAASGKTIKVKRGPFRAVFETDGVFVPVHASEVAIAPKAYEGELRIAEVVAHGARVRQGDVILRLEDEKARDMVQAGEWAVRAAERNVADAKTRFAEYEADTKRDLARAEKDLALAEASLKAFYEVSRPLEKEEYELGERSYKHGIADQEDELAQLGKMYKEDQLTEETEEIVLKRAKRSLEESKKRLELFVRRHAYQEKFIEPAEVERLENGVKDKQKSVKDLKRTRESGQVLGAIDQEKLEHDAAAAARRLERLRQDLEGLAIRAPHDGIVLHGSFEDKVAVSPLRRHQVVQPLTPILAVAYPGHLKVRFSLKEKDRYRLTAGMGASIVPVALSDRRFTGSVEPVSGFPLPDSTWNAHVIFAHEDERLLPLLNARVSIVLHESLDAFTVPLGAVFRRGDKTVCFVRAPSPFGIAARTVVTGPDNGKDILVREGLCEGDEVLLEEPAS